MLQTLLVCRVAPAPYIFNQRDSVQFMSGRAPRYRSTILTNFAAALVFFFFGALSIGFPASVLGQVSVGRTAVSPRQDHAGDRTYHYFGAPSGWNWNQRGRSVPGAESSAVLRLHAYRQKMAMRAARAIAAQSASSLKAPPHRSLNTAADSSASTGWVPLGPAPLASDATGDGMQDYNWVSGRAISVLIDPADTTGNTVLLGGAYGGLWKSKNAGSLSPDPNPGPASVVWQPLIDDQPSLAVGAIALQPGNSTVILVGTGETNNSADSYYGLGILLSTNAGSTWTQITGIGQPPNVDQSFMGIGFSKIAFGGTANPNLVVAATAGDNGLCVGEEAGANNGNNACLGPEEDGSSTARGLYYSTNAGATWSRAIMTDGSVPASATAVIYNPSQGSTGTFYAFIRRHGLYSSTDGQHFAPVTTLPIAGLASANCPTGSNATTCTIYRGEFAVVPGRNEMYVWVVDVQPDQNGDPQPFDEGIWQSLNGGTSWTQILDNGITNCGDSAFGLDSGCGVEQGWYNLALAAVPNGSLTDIYAGAVNLYKCTLAGSTTCTQGDWINLTHVYGCNPGPLGAPAHVHPNQHGMAFMAVNGTSPGYFAHDGGISRTLDGYGGLNTGSCTGANQFDSLSQPQSASNSQTLGSMTEFVSFSTNPQNANVILGGTQGNGSPKTSTATTSATWQNALGGDGGFSVINPTNLSEWFAANPYLTISKCESGTDCSDSLFLPVIGSSNLGGDQGAYNTPYMLDPQDSSEMLVGTCRVWRIGTDASNPVQLSNDFDTLGTGLCTGDEVNLVNALAAGGSSASGMSTVVYAVTDGYGPLSEITTGIPGGQVWATTNAGIALMENVTQNVNPNAYAISTVAMDASDATGSTAYVGIMGFSTPSYPTSHVWQTTNGGASWTDWSGTASTALPDNPVNALLVDSQAGQIYAGTDVGVFSSSTASPSWTEVGPTPAPAASGFLPDAPVTALQLSNPPGTAKTLLASTYGRGIWTYILAPDFVIALAATPDTTGVGQNVTWNGTVTALNGYNGTITLSCTGTAVPGICQIPSPTLTPTPAGTAFTVTLGSATAGTFTFMIQGADAILTNFTPPETLTVGLALTWKDTGDASATVLAGQSAAYKFSAAPVGSATFSSAVSFACSNQPALTNCVFNPASLAAGAVTTPVTLTITTTGPNTESASGSLVTPARRVAYTARRLPPAPKAVVPKVQKAVVQANPIASEPRTNDRNPGQKRTQDFTLPPPTFPLFPLAWLVVAGIVGLGRTRRGKPPLYIGIAVTGLGLGLMAELSCGGVVGSGNSAENFTIALTASPNVTGPSPEAVIWNGTLTALNGYNANVTLSCTSGGPGVCAISPPVVVPSIGGAQFAATLGNATAGNFVFAIQGTDGTLTNATPPESLTVTAGTPDFSLAMTSAPSPTPVNQSITWTGTATAQSGYTGNVTLSCTPGFPGTCAFAPQVVTPTTAGTPFTVTLNSTTAGTFTFVISGTDGTLTSTTPDQTLVVGSGVATPGFQITITPTPSSVGVSPQSAIWNGTLTALNGYTGTVTLSCTTGAPQICVPSPPLAPTAAGAPFTVTLGSATSGTFNFAIQATDGTLTNSTPTETLTVGTGTAITITPPSATLFADETGNAWPAGITQQQFTAVVNTTTSQTVNWAVGGGAANGTVSNTGLYSAPAVVLSPTTVTVTATSAVSVAATGSASVTLSPATPIGTSQITVTATPTGGAPQQDVVTLIVH